MSTPHEASEVTRQLIERDQRGRAKYGTSLDRTDLSLSDWLQHLAEELLDAAGYALAAKRTAHQPAPVVDDELPGMWSQSDFTGGATDAADNARQPAPVVDDAMVDRYLAAQAKAVQEIDDAWGNGGKAASYLHPVREACRAGLTAALARAQGVQS